MNVLKGIIKVSRASSALSNDIRNIDVTMTDPETKQSIAVRYYYEDGIITGNRVIAGIEKTKTKTRIDKFEYTNISGSYDIFKVYPELYLEFIKLLDKNKYRYPMFIYSITLHPVASVHLVDIGAYAKGVKV